MPKFLDVTDPDLARSAIDAASAGDSMADYVITATGTACEALNTVTGQVDYQVASGDHRPIFTSAIASLLSPSGPTGAKGGRIAFRGLLNFQSQLVIPSAIAIEGLVGWSTEGQGIESSFNGSILLVTGVTGGNNNVVLRNLRIFGDLTKTSQCGIEFNDSGGYNMRDCILEDVFVDHVGQHAIKVRGGLTTTVCKIWMDRCELEFCGGDGINAEGDVGTRMVVNSSYIIKNVGCGFKGSARQGIAFQGGTIISSNDSGNIQLSGSVREFSLNSCIITSDGLGSTPQISYVGASGVTVATSTVQIVGNTFKEGGAGIVNHIAVGTSYFAYANIVGNSFQGHSGDAIVWRGDPSNVLNIKSNWGYNNVKGQIATPFRSGRIGAGGTAAVPSSSTTYTADGTDLMVVSTGGTGVSITITDPAGNTVQSALASFGGILPNGYRINWGAYSTQPSSLYVGVV